MPPIRIYLSALLGAVISTFAQMANALPEDRNQPINIQSDSAQLDDGKGVATYMGKVKLTQGSLVIEGDEVRIYRNAQGDVDRAVAVGKLAHFVQVPEQGKPPVDGKAKQIEYFVAEQRATLEQSAVVTQGGNAFTGEKIDYDIKKQLLNAAGNASSNTRVNMTLQPSKKNPQ